MTLPELAGSAGCPVSRIHLLAPPGRGSDALKARVAVAIGVPARNLRAFPAGGKFDARQLDLADAMTPAGTAAAGGTR